MAGKVKEICFEKLQPVISDLGYDLVEVYFGKQVDGLNLIFYIDNDEGIKIEDCEKVHRAIDPILDEIDPTGDDKYILSVSSLGIDRPLKTERDFKRNLGKEVEVSLYAKVNGKKIFKGILLSYADDTVTIDCKGQITFEKKQVANIVPVLKF